MGIYPHVADRVAEWCSRWPPTGKETVLYTFEGGADGGYPWNDSMVLDKAGNLYGTTYQGGDVSCPGGCGSGCGVIFKVDPLTLDCGTRIDEICTIILLA